MTTARRTRLTLHHRPRAARSTTTPFHFFIPGDAHHPVNGVTFDDVEATADFAYQLGPPPAEVITQTQGDAPTAGNIPCYPPPPGVGGGMNPPPPPPQQADMGGGATAHRGFGILRHRLRHPKIGGQNVRPGDHPGRARSAAKGNPWRPGKSDVIPRVRGQCSRVPGVLGHARKLNTCLYDSHPRSVLLPCVRHQHLPG